MCIRRGKMGTFKVHSDGAPPLLPSSRDREMADMNTKTVMDGHWLEVEVGDLRMSSNNLILPVTAV